MSSTPNNADGWTGGQTATLSARQEQILEVKRARILPFVLLMIPMVVLLIAMMLRFESMGARLQDLPSAWKYLISLVAVLFIVALLIGNVYFAGLGNKLGDISRALQRIFAESDDRRRSLDEEIRDQQVVAGRAVVDARQELLKLKELHLRPSHSVESGRYALAAIHRVAEVPVLDYRAIVTRKPHTSAIENGDPLPSLEDALYGETPVWDRYAQMRTELQLVKFELDRLQEVSRSAPRIEPAAQATDRVRNPWEALAKPADSTPDRAQLGGWMTEQTAGDRPLFPSAEPIETPRQRRKGRALIGVIILVLLIAAALTWYSLDGSSAQATVPSSMAATNASPVVTGGTGVNTIPVITSDGLIPASPAPPSELKEGKDYSYLESTATGGHLRWQCNDPIKVVIAGPADSSARGLVSTALEEVTGASSLPLTLGQDLPSYVTQPDEGQSGQIVVNFLDAAQVTAAHLDMDQDALGRTNTRSKGSNIDSAIIVIRTGIDAYTLQETLMHELGHAVGLGHAGAAETEIMKPVTETLKAAPSWGNGDLYALQSVGCPKR